MCFIVLRLQSQFLLSDLHDKRNNCMETIWFKIFGHEVSCKQIMFSKIVININKEVMNFEASSLNFTLFYVQFKE